MDAPDTQKHPVRRLGGTIGRLPRYLRLGKSLLTDPRLPRRRKALLAVAAGYAISPIDLVPGIIPVAGQLDDLAALLLALRLALGGLPREAATEHLAAVGLSAAALDEDLATVKDTAKWLMRSAGRGLRWTGVTAFKAARSAAGRLRDSGRLGRPAAGRLRRPR